MAEYTEKLNLKKPSQEDFYDVADFNGNADILEEEISALKDWKATFKAWFLENLLPVNTIITRGDMQNPGEIYGGTWEPYAPGRMSINLDTSDPDFNEVGKTGGSKTASYPLGNNGYAKIDATATSPVTLKYARKSVDSYDTHFTMTCGQGSSLSETASTTSRAVLLGGSTEEDSNMPPYIVDRKWIRVA